jgi:hypothetical protein
MRFYKKDILLAIYGIVALAPSVFFNLQLHHDGYVLETGILFEKRILSGASYPFSQYGPLWSGVLALVTLITPDGFEVLSIRMLTIFIYGFCIFLGARIFRRVTGRTLSITVVSLYVCAWYMFGPYHGWPSSIALLLTMSCLRIATEIILAPNLQKVSHFYVGILVGLIFLCRIQIAIIWIVLWTIMSAFKRRSFPYLPFAVGYITSILITSLALNVRGWLPDAYYDLIIFASRYHLNPDRGSTRFPIWTFIVLIATALLIYLVRNLSYLENIVLIFVKTGIIVGGAVVTFEMLDVVQVPHIIHWQIFQRLFVGLVLGVFLYILLSAMSRQLLQKAKLEDGRKRDLEHVYLLIVMASLGQVYPLFSAHHTWYALLPVLIVTTTLKNVNTYLSSLRATTFVVSGLVVFIYLFMGLVSSIHAPIEQQVRVSRPSASYLKDWKLMLKYSIPRDKTVWNFCADPTTFIVRPDLMPGSRIFVWWPHFEEIYGNTTVSSTRDNYAVVCPEGLQSWEKFTTRANWTERTSQEIENLGLVYVFQRN